MEIKKENHGSKSFGEDIKLQFTNSSRKRTQEKIIFSYLYQNVATNSMIAVSTGIPRASICKVKRKLEQRGKLFEVKKDICKVSKHKAWYLSSNPELVSSLKILQDG